MIKRIFTNVFRVSQLAKQSSQLTAISPLDGRYAKNTLALRDFYSEFALQKYRIKVEVEWLKFLFQNNMINQNNAELITALDLIQIDAIYHEFTPEQGKRVKEIESITNHDVKAIEYYIKEELEKSKYNQLFYFNNLEASVLHQLKEYVHFCCTSEDINNLAYSLMMKDAKEKVLNKYTDDVIHRLTYMSEEYAGIPMLSRTHGQPATPTTLGKELANFTYRAAKQQTLMKNLKFAAKMNGAVGNFNAHMFAYPEHDWPSLSKQFITQLGLEFNPYTTQIESHDQIALFYSYFTIFNTILIGFSRDMWQYISIGYFKQKTKKHEVGSSTMPHKVNPIDFENCEGQLGMANALGTHFSQKLPISRFQRDLSDSTVMRNHGVAQGYAIAGWASLLKGLDRVEPNYGFIDQDLDNHWEVLAEPIQQVMRKYKLENPYEQLKEVTRGAKVDKELLREFIKKQNLPESEKQRMLELTPKTYIGNALKMAKEIKQHL